MGLEWAFAGRRHSDIVIGKELEKNDIKRKIYNT